MAIKRFKRDNFGNGIHSEFFIDSVEDLEVIEDIYDCELGDKAFTPAGAEYVRHPDDFDGDLWVLVSKQGGSDGSGEGSGGMMLVTYDRTSGFANKTFKEVWDAVLEGQIVIHGIDSTDDSGFVSFYALESLDKTGFQANFGNNSLIADSENGYLYYAD